MYSTDSAGMIRPIYSGLDLFSGAGGASMGYACAGIEMVGIDWRAQPRYPFEFIQSDVRAFFDRDNWLDSFDFIHASPPCQEHSRLQTMVQAQVKKPVYINLIPSVREVLERWAARTGGLYIIENVVRAPIRNDVTLCGTQFGLGWGGKQLQRHRWFETNFKPWRKGCNHSGSPWGVYGSLRDNIPRGGQTPPTLDAARSMMGIDWMIWKELKESIPPVYTHFLGQQVVEKFRKIGECERELYVRGRC